MNHLTNSFPVGSEVSSIKTGYPGIGRIVGVLLGEVYSLILKPNGCVLWDRMYPTWRESFIYVVYFEQPRRPASREDILLAFPEATKEWREDMFNGQPTLQLVAFPEDDLEPIQ